MKRTKIVATIGPASESKEVLKKLFEEGVNVCRLNFSHGDFSWHKKLIRRIRNISSEMGMPIGIMADLQGPRIRIANKSEIKIRDGEIVWLKSIPLKDNKNSETKTIFLDLERAENLIKKGNEILIEDGLIKLKVIGKEKAGIKCAAESGGTIKPQKGVNIPGISAMLGALTKEDKKVLDFILKEDVDFVAMSFVRSAKEILELKKIIKDKSEKSSNVPQIIAKIERREAVRDFDSILKATDVVMIARGDLGVEMPQSEVPIIQKEISVKCLRFGKPVIVATQMLDSMIHNPRPTRAEVSDVSNAVVDHSDAVMLSGETANGKYPVEAVKIMKEIIEKTEESPYDDLTHGFLGDKKSSVSAAVAQSAHELMKDSGAKAVIVASISGFTARMIARHRPDEKIFVMTNNQKTHNQLSIVWGTESFVLPYCKSLDELLDKSLKVIERKNLLNKGDKIVIVAGRPHIKKEHMSLIKVDEIK